MGQSSFLIIPRGKPETTHSWPRTSAVACFGPQPTTSTCASAYPLVFRISLAPEVGRRLRFSPSSKFTRKRRFSSAPPSRFSKPLAFVPVVPARSSLRRCNQIDESRSVPSTSWNNPERSVTSETQNETRPLHRKMGKAYARYSTWLAGWTA